MTDQLLSQLRATLGDNGLLVGTDTQPFLVEPRNVFHGTALAVARPGSTREVAELLGICSRAEVSVIPQGGNTGLSGGATPIDAGRPSIILSLTRMNLIEAVNPDRWSMTVQAGATIQSMQEAADSAGRLFAPDWGARGTATIGGAIACDAGGINVLRYGTTREQILGLEVVLPDGQIWDGLRSLRKDATGYDLKHIFIGSEGTLGVVTRAEVRLWPATPHSITALAAIPDIGCLPSLFESAMKHVSASLTAFELIPDVGLHRVCEVFGLPRPIAEPTEFYALIKLEAGRPVDDVLASFLETAANGGLISDAVVASTPQQTVQLWTMRDELPPMSIYRDTQHEGLKMDTAVPLDKIGEYQKVVQTIAADLVPDALCYGFGHAGDGNIHMMILPTTAEDISSFRANKAELKRRVDDATIALGGTLSAEHGVGQELRDRVSRQKPAIEWEMMRRLKRLFDPDGIMNPGKLLPPP
ncbi:MAG: FAD-binding oxidoreductase [Acidimicrobiales bacterium]